MKLRDKKGTIKFWGTDPANNTTYEVDPRRDINRFQYGKMVQRPQFILPMAHHLREEMKKIGIANPIIRVDAMISLNFRPFQQAIDPNVDLAKIKSEPFGHETWILPLDPTLKPGTLEVEAKQKTKQDTEESGVLE